MEQLNQIQRTLESTHHLMSPLLRFCLPFQTQIRSLLVYVTAADFTSTINMVLPKQTNSFSYQQGFGALFKFISVQCWHPDCTFLDSASELTKSDIDEAWAKVDVQSKSTHQKSNPYFLSPHDVIFFGFEKIIVATSKLMSSVQEF